MTQIESPFDSLIRTAREVSDERYYVRKTNTFDVPRGVMTRLQTALKNFERYIETGEFDIPSMERKLPDQ